jgi:hypothetical protein
MQTAGLEYHLLGPAWRPGGSEASRAGIPVVSRVMTMLQTRRQGQTSSVVLGGCLAGENVVIPALCGSSSTAWSADRTTAGPGGMYDCVPFSMRRRPSINA